VRLVSSLDLTSDSASPCAFFVANLVKIPEDTHRLHQALCRWLKSCDVGPLSVVTDFFNCHLPLELCSQYRPRGSSCRRWMFCSVRPPALPIPKEVVNRTRMPVRCAWLSVFLYRFYCDYRWDHARQNTVKTRQRLARGTATVLSGSDC
jgi:hypothetical protein